METLKYYINNSGENMPTHANDQYIEGEKRFKDLSNGDIIYSLNEYTGDVRTYIVDKIKIDEKLTYVDILDYPVKQGVVWLYWKTFGNQKFYTRFRNVWWSYDYANDAVQGFNEVFYCTSKDTLFGYVEQKGKFNINYIKNQLK